MLRLVEALRAWGKPEFKAVLKREIERLEAEQLPLQQGLARSSSVADTPFTAMIMGVEDMGGIIRVRVGILYQGEIAGCSCAGDPGAADEIAEYCEIRLDIDRTTAVAEAVLLQ